MPLPQHYLACAPTSPLMTKCPTVASTTSARGAQTFADTISLLGKVVVGNEAATSITSAVVGEAATSTSAHVVKATIGAVNPVAMKDPATSTTADMTCSITCDIERINNDSKEPITRFWYEDEEDKEKKWGVARFVDGHWKI